MLSRFLSGGFGNFYGVDNIKDLRMMSNSKVESVVVYFIGWWKIK